MTLLQAQVYTVIIWNGAYNPNHCFDQWNGEPLFQESIKSAVHNHVKEYVNFL